MLNNYSHGICLNSNNIAQSKSPGLAMSETPEPASTINFSEFNFGSIS
jgi:hypothetical protein